MTMGNKKEQVGELAPTCPFFTILRVIKPEKDDVLFSDQYTNVLI